MSILAYKNSQNNVYKQCQPFHAVINHDARPTIVYAPLMLIVKMGQGANLFLFRSLWRPMHPTQTLTYWIQNWVSSSSIWMAREIVQTNMQNLRLALMVAAQPGRTCRLTGTGPGLAHKEPTGRVIERVCNQTNQVFRSKTGPLASYPDPLVIQPAIEWVVEVSRLSLQSTP